MRKTYITLVACIMIAAGAQAQQEVSVVDNTLQKRCLLRPVAVKHDARKAAEVVALPYFESFDTDESVESFTIIDANDDSNTWGYSNGKMEYFAEIFEDNPGDDWLITPSFALQAGQKYEISLKASAFEADSPEAFEVFLGKKATVEGMTIGVLQKTVVATDQPTVYAANVSVAESGNYCLGIHCVSDPDMFSLYIDDISIKAGAEPTAPATVADLTVTPDATGELSAQVSFHAPTVTADGEALKKIDKIQLLRDEELLKTFENVSPGQMCTYSDVTPKNGSNIYSVVVYGDGGAGNAATSTAFIGVDVLDVPLNAQATNEGGDAVISWQVPDKGWNGHYVNPEKTYATIYVTRDGINRDIIVEQASSTRYVHKDASAGGEQYQVAYQIYLNNAAGRGQKSNTNMVILGKSYGMPFRESLSGGSTDNKFWSLDRGSTSTKVLATNLSHDGDKGSFLLCTAAKDELMTLYSGKIDIREAASPVLPFHVKSSSAADAFVIPKAYKDGKELKQGSALNFDSDGWQLVTLDLADLREQGYVQVAFTVNFGNAPADILIDNIQVTDGVPTGIEDCAKAVYTDSGDAVLYNIAGQRVDDSYHGIVIVNGHKVIK